MNTIQNIRDAAALVGGMLSTKLGRVPNRSEITDLLSPSSEPILKNTLNATPVAVSLLQTVAGRVYSVAWRIRGYDRDNNRCYMQEGVGQFSNVGGTLTELVNTVVGEGQHAGGAMAAPVTVVSPALSVALTGEAAGANGVDWDVRFWVTETQHLNAGS